MNETQTIKTLELQGRTITLIGTAHISKDSIEEVSTVIRELKPSRVCIELDEDRYRSIQNEKGWSELDIVKVLKEGKGFLLLTNLVLSSFQKRIGEDLGVKPGDEMKEAILISEELGIPTSMVDRPIHTTLQRAWAKTSFWGKSKLLAVLVSSAFSNEELSEQDIENLKQQGAMDSMMEELTNYLPQIKEVLIDERDRYLASNIWKSEGNTVVAVLGAGHLPGTEDYLQKLSQAEATSNTSDIQEVPPKTLGSKLAGWIFPAILLALIVSGFFVGGAVTSLDMLVRWLLWNGSLAAAGTLVALGHPLAIITAFIGAPIATINPFIGVGLFSGLAQAFVKKPQVKDMENLSKDVTSFKGFYKNRISHVLLVFFLSSLGGAIGNFIAVPALIGSLIK